MLQYTNTWILLSILRNKILGWYTFLHINHNKLYLYCPILVHFTVKSIVIKSNVSFKSPNWFMTSWCQSLVNWSIDYLSFMSKLVLYVLVWGMFQYGVCFSIALRLGHLTTHVYLFADDVDFIIILVIMELLNRI